ncbi:MAG: hypothetical protein Kow0068_25370 [Marinilabiliales bacterium]
MKRIIITSLILLSVLIAFGQRGKWGIGASGIYNFNTKDYGLSARVLIPVKDKMWAVPCVYHYFNTGETSGSLSALIPFKDTKSLTWYILVSGTFQGHAKVSVNNESHSESGSYEADGEAGVGVFIGPGCLKGFVEPRYAVSYEEFTLRAGVVYFFGCSGRGHSKRRHGGGGHKKAKGDKGGLNKGKKSICPAYDY